MPTPPPQPPEETPDERRARLRVGAQVVGYRRAWPAPEGGGAPTTFYSLNGATWSGAAIAHDAWDPDTGLRDCARRRIYRGDVLTITGRGKPLKAIVVDAEEPGGLALLVLGRGALEPLRDRAGAPRHLAASVRITGLAWAVPEWAELVTEARALGRPARDVAWAAHGALGLAQLAGAGAVVAAQLAMSGSVGPLTTVGGVLGATIVFFVLAQRRDPRWLSRARLFRLAGGALVAQGVAAGLVYAGCVAWLPERMGAVVRNPAVAVAVFGLLMGALAAIATVLIGDLFAWQRGGYAGELRPRRPDEEA